MTSLMTKLKGRQYHHITIILLIILISNLYSLYIIFLLIKKQETDSYDLHVDGATVIESLEAPPKTMASPSDMDRLWEKRPVGGVPCVRSLDLRCYKLTRHLSSVAKAYDPSPALAPGS